MSNGGNACSFSSHFRVRVWAKLVRSRTHPDEDPQEAKPCTETTEKLVYVYSTQNSKMAATVRYADELKMVAWDNEDV